MRSAHFQLYRAQKPFSEELGHPADIGRTNLAEYRATQGSPLHLLSRILYASTNESSARLAGRRPAHGIGDDLLDFALIVDRVGFVPGPEEEDVSPARAENSSRCASLRRWARN